MAVVTIKIEDQDGGTGWKATWDIFPMPEDNTPINDLSSAQRLGYEIIQTIQRVSEMQQQQMPVVGESAPINQENSDET